MFTIKKQRWVHYWIKQPAPLMLVIGTFEEALKAGSAKEKKFADIRWMEVGDLLRRESDNGKKAVKQIEFRGERLDALSVRRWRETLSKNRDFKPSPH